MTRQSRVKDANAMKQTKVSKPRVLTKVGDTNSRQQTLSDDGCFRIENTPNIRQAIRAPPLFPSWLPAAARGCYF
jgi:hypothetical protein